MAGSLFLRASGATDIDVTKKSFAETTFDAVFSFGSDLNWTCSTALHSPQHVFDIDGLFHRPKRQTLRAAHAW